VADPKKSLPEPAGKPGGRPAGGPGSAIPPPPPGFKIVSGGPGAADEEKKAIIGELYRRRDTLDLEKRAVVDELAGRFGMRAPAGPGSSIPPPPPGFRVVGASETPQTADWFEKNRNPVAPGTSDDDLIREFGFDPEEIKRSPRYQSSLQKYGTGLGWLLSDPERNDVVAKLADSPLGDLGMGVADALSGVHQLLVHGMNKAGLIPDEDAKFVDLVNRITAEDFARNIRKGKGGTVARIAGNMVVPVPKVGAVASGASRLAKAGRIAAEGAAAAAMQPVTGGDPESFWTEKAEQAGIGAAVAPVVAGTVKAAGAVANKLTNANSAPVRPLTRGEAAMEAGEQFGVRTTFGDVSRNTAARKAEVQLESVPVGMASQRAAQQTEVKAAAGRIQNKLRQQFEETAGEEFGDIVAAADAGDEYARKILPTIQAAGRDPAGAMQAGIAASNFRTKQEAKALYDQVAELVERNNLPEVPLSNTAAALEDSLRGLYSSKLRTGAEQPAARLLENLKANSASGNTYDAIRQLRSDLGEEIRGFYEGSNAIIGEKGVQYLQSVRSAVEKDLQEFVDRSGVPEVQAAARKADGYYRTMRIPFRDPMIARAAVTTEPDQIFSKFIQAGKEDRAQKFYNALDAKGRAAVRYQIVADAAEKATDSASGVFSPQKFYSALDKTDEAFGVFFKGPDRWEIDGFKNLMAHVTRAGQAAENPPTGNRLVPLLAGGAGAATAIIGGAVPFATGYGLLKGAELLFTTRAGKKYLLASSQARPGTKAMENLLEMIRREVPQATSRAAGGDTGK
jgi:hypothetical protein